MGRSRGRSRGRAMGSSVGGYDGSEIDYKGLRDEHERIQKDIDEYKELGDKYVGEKKSIEDYMDKLEELPFSIAEKKRICNVLQDGLTDLQEDYEKKVGEPLEQLEQEDREIISVMQEGAEKFKEQAEELGRLKMETGAVDMSQAIKEAERGADDFKEAKSESQQSLELKLQQFQDQGREMRRKKLSKSR